MNSLEAQLTYPLGDALPSPGQTLEVAPGVRWIRMALPFALDHINLWLLRDRLDGREGWTVVDCCITRDESKAQWEQVFASSLDGLPVLRVLVTHMHPDHIGLAHWLCERWSTPEHPCRLWISATDYNAARVGSQSTTGFGGESAARFFAAHGLTGPADLEQIRGRANYYRSMVPAVPGSFRRLADGDVVRIGGRDWTCISGYGHAPEHIALSCGELRVLISGDMVLPRISTNVSVHDVEPESDPLRAFLASLDKFRHLPPDTLVLPSHGKPFTGLHQRIDQLHAHHRERLAEVLEACTARPSTAAEMLPVLFKRPLDLHQTTFAMGESVAHLHALWFAGQLRRQRGSDGTYRFAAA
ncbi:MULTISPECIES: MBL fold metallo-hydrolase [Ramlibacter]|uniref:MBL fold metallo-hydrolase n=1 Tax=Ramlibacter pinisoli TaxID=2682844 RepID=A0A6N8J1S0_9BURK|nr:MULTISPECIES: MBL fold metallo-hydrolase [Ramlibacter]MBA2962800.1 MBL fold metallo-hydrolase [Ramlibacter sp. CGMCC 1.13660]MVQ32742.1 MBL fold metallo-hydrolase [Ramlibacter pinisoli]